MWRVNVKIADSGWIVWRVNVKIADSGWVAWRVNVKIADWLGSVAWLYKATGAVLSSQWERQTPGGAENEQN